jgi:hypothetical protein
MTGHAAVTLEVVPVRSKRDEDAFLRLPWRLYRADPAWIPNLLILQRDVISRKRNPFFDHGKAQLFLARREGEVVGRISAQIDHRHVDHHQERAGFFGFFEAVDDASVSRALFGAAEAWLRERGMTCSRGPFNFSIDEEVGILVEGFDHSPMIGMTHSLPYYGPLIEAAGYAKAMDLSAYRWQIKPPPARMLAAIERTRAAPGLRLRPINMRRLRRDVDLLLDIYNQAWGDNWGYVPVSRRAARKLAADLRLIADPKIVLIAEVEGEAAGMVVGLPNLYEAIHDFNGFIDPWKALKLLWRLKVRGPETGRIMIFGVKPKFQRRRDLYGLPFLLLYELYRAGQKRRYKWCEESWVLENNARLNAIMPYWDAHVYKRYRIYEKAL